MRIFTAINVSKERKSYMPVVVVASFVLNKKRRLPFAPNAGLILGDEQAV
jgi:hypothetical protein